MLNSQSCPLDWHLSVQVPAYMPSAHITGGDVLIDVMWGLQHCAQELLTCFLDHGC